MITLRGFSKRYGTVQALDQVDLEIHEGEIVALAGENGSGKSTLARIVAGVADADEGHLEIDGAPARFESPHDAIAAGIALVSQETTVVPMMTVAENVLLPRLPRGLSRVSRRQMAQTARPALERVGLACDPLTNVADLSVADAVLVEVAKALLSGPRLLILDEATSRLGEAEVERLLDVVTALRDDGVSSILITHRLAEICRVADRAVVLRDGTNVGTLVADEMSEASLSRTMVGRELVDFFHKRDIVRGEPVLSVSDLVPDGYCDPMTFEVHAGELVAFAGLVGSGRTELLETIAGARRAESGHVRVGGRTVRPGSPRAALACGVALVPEDRRGQGVILSGSVRENVALGSWSARARASVRDDSVVAADAVERLKIKTPGLGAPIGTLSGGNQQKVVLGRCLSRSPRVLVLDEPTRGIDVGAKEELFQLIGQMLADGMAVVLATSEMLETLGLADRIFVLHERRVVAEMSRAEATEERIALLAGGGVAA